MVTKSLNVGLVMNLVIMLLSFLKEWKNTKKNIKSRRPRDCLYANEDDESDERVQSESDDELGFLFIKEENPKIEVTDENSLVSHV